MPPTEGYIAAGIVTGEARSPAVMHIMTRLRSHFKRMTNQDCHYVILAVPVGTAESTRKFVLDKLGVKVEK
jgi:hypothetical protein